MNLIPDPLDSLALLRGRLLIDQGSDLITMGRPSCQLFNAAIAANGSNGPESFKIWPRLQDQKKILKNVNINKTPKSHIDSQAHTHNVNIKKMQKSHMQG